MTPLDAATLLILTLAALKGWATGLLRQIASTTGLLIGLATAILLTPQLTPLLTTQPTGIAHTITFLLIWIAIPLTLSTTATLLTHTIHHTPLGTLNRATGTLFATLKYLLILSLLLNTLHATHLWQPTPHTYTLYHTITLLTTPLFQHTH